VTRLVGGAVVDPVHATRAVRDVVLPGPDDVIDVTGRWVCPGLVDAHAHVSDLGQAPVWLSYGVTEVHDMWGSPLQLRWRSMVEQGTLPGPRLVAASPYFDGVARYPGIVPTTDAADARSRAETYVAEGFDALKVYSGLAPECLAAVCEVGAAQGVPVIGHCPQGMSWREALALGMTGFEHLVELWAGTLRGDRGAVRALPSDVVDRVRIIDAELDRDELRRVAELMRQVGATACPTLTIWGRVAGDHDSAGTRLVPEAARQRWARSGLPERPGLAAAIRRQQEIVGEVALLLHDAGVELRVGTDAGSRWCPAGATMADELRHLQDAGFPAAEVLRSATRSRTVEDASGALVLDADPLLDVLTATAPALVVTGGQVLNRADLDLAVEAYAASVDATLTLAEDELGPMARPVWWDR
jgi:imidazolonepropionase-like amidohydrolase